MIVFQQIAYPEYKGKQAKDLKSLLTERKDFFTTLSIHNILNPSLRDDVLNKLIQECKNKPDIYKKINRDALAMCFSGAILILIGYKATKLYVQLTPQNSLVVKGVSGNENTFLEFFFEETMGCLTQTIANIFINKGLQLSDSGDIHEVFASLRYFHEDYIPVPQSFINSYYDVPDDIFAEVEVLNYCR